MAPDAAGPDKDWRVNRSVLTLLLVVAAVSGSCGEPGERRTAERPEQPQQSAPVAASWLSRYDLGDDDVASFRLAKPLGEISGLAMMKDGRLFCHDDESPIIYQIDESGTIVKRFTIGSGFMEEDFEGIAVKEDTLFMVNSSGSIFEFLESGDREHSEFTLFRTPLSRRNDVEGLEYDPETDCLLLACKDEPGDGYDGFKAVYAFSLRTRSLEAKPRFLIPLKEVEKKARKGKFNPSGIALHPVSGTFFIISADGELAIEIDRTGRILDQRKISGKVNSQPEGIVFTKDNTMLIANDGQGERGTLTVYPAGKEGE